METRKATGMEETLSAKLFEFGLTPEPVTIMKNRVECTGIRILDTAKPNISPVVYYSKDEPVDVVMDRITAAIQHTPPQICVDQLTDPEYITEHLYMTIQRWSDDPENVVKKTCMNLELVLRVTVKLGDQEGSVKVSRDMLELADMSEDAGWAIARHNMTKRLRLQSIIEALGIPEEFVDDIPMAVCTTGTRQNGAAALAIPELFQAFCDSFESKGAYLLPSSTEELIVIPDNLGSLSVAEMARMVEEINQTVVEDPLITLDPVVYRYDLESNTISIVAAFEEGGVQ